jgi:hypothetical protein
MANRTQTRLYTRWRGVIAPGRLVETDERQVLSRGWQCEEEKPKSPPARGNTMRLALEKALNSKR